MTSERFSKLQRLDPVCTRMRRVAQTAAAFMQRPSQVTCTQTRTALIRALAAVDKFQNPNQTA